MTVPGSNLLKRAARLIAQQSVDYYQDIGRTNNAAGLNETQYAVPVKVQGSVQAVPLNAYESLGLDFGKNYVTLYTSTKMIGIERDVSGDVFTYCCKVYQCRSITNWIAQDGWNAVLAVETTTDIPTIIRRVVTPQGNFIGAPQG